MDILEVMDVSRIDLDLDAKTKDEVISKVADLFEKSGVLLDKKQFIKDVYIREEEGPTGMGDGFCIPHGKSDAVKKSSIAICRTRDYVEWESLDDKPIKVVVMMAIKNTDKSHLVSLLSQIAVALCDETVVERLFVTTDKSEVIELFKTRKEEERP